MYLLYKKEADKCRLRQTAASSSAKNWSETTVTCVRENSNPMHHNIARFFVRNQCYTWCQNSNNDTLHPTRTTTNEAIMDLSGHHEILDCVLKHHKYHGCCHEDVDLAHITSSGGVTIYKGAGHCRRICLATCLQRGAQSTIARSQRFRDLASTCRLSK